MGQVGMYKITSQREGERAHGSALVPSLFLALESTFFISFVEERAI